MSVYKFLPEALLALVPDHGFQIVGNYELTNLTWQDIPDPMPSDADIVTKCEALQTEYDAQEYARDRQPEYPPILDYIDGVVKDDQTQIDKYIEDCKAIKAKYPKPQ
jgi:hypothetical protein